MVLIANLPKVQTTSVTTAVFRRFLSRWSAIWAHAAVDDRPRPRWRPPVDPADTAEVPPCMSHAIPRSMPWGIPENCRISTFWIQRLKGVWRNCMRHWGP